ncbi:MAG: BrnT family toxin [Rhodospirillaceae bacterium]|nr:BrnT family toxin [Rhodospirillaceae bacterium]
MRFEWDEGKAAANLRKHGVDFEDALQIFAGFVRVLPDRRHDYGEDRFIALGELRGRIVKVVFTRRGGAYRIISAWKANKRDQATYRQNDPG